MSIVTVVGVDRALAAGEWAKKNIISKWTLDMQPFSNIPQYDFVFSNEHDASWFALRWR